MNKKVINYIYIIFIIFLMVIPVFFMNHNKNEKSFIDNTYLPEFPELMVSKDLPKEIENYINKRIGFREEAVFLYELGVSEIFNKLEHSLYTYGENGYIMGNMDTYIEDYQHLNLSKDTEFVDAFAEYLNNANQYLDQENIIFLYFLAPDKKTIYYEYMPNTINVYGNVSRTDMLLDKLQGVPYIYPKEAFLKAKETEQIYNVKYDALHWNDLGNFLGNKLIDENFQNYNRNIIPLSENQFELSYMEVGRLASSNFYIDEWIPLYSLIDEEAIQDVTSDDEYGLANVKGDFEHYINIDLKQGAKILIFHDSYMVGSAKFYKGRYGEVISVHNSNYYMLQEYVEHYQPDIVLFENVERVLATDFFDIETLKEWNAL